MHNHPPRRPSGFFVPLKLGSRKVGSTLKKTGTMAREDIEAFIGKKVYLDINVKVNKDWRNSDVLLRRFGYEA